MAIELRDVVLLGKEATRGTAAASTPLDQPIEPGGLAVTRTNTVAAIEANSAWPSKAGQVPTGVTHSLTLTPRINRDTIRDLVLLATKRTNGILPEATIIHAHRVGVGSISGSNPQMRYLGCVCSGFNWSMNRSSSPVLSGTMTAECMQGQAHTGAVAGTPAFARSFQIRHSVLTINSVVIADLESVSIQLANALQLGAPDAADKRLHIEDGMESLSLDITARLVNVNLRDLLLAGTEHSASLVLATGTTNETVTLTMGACQITSQTLERSDEVITEKIMLVPHHTGAAQQGVWTFGSAIGASVLSL